MRLNWQASGGNKPMGKIRAAHAGEADTITAVIVRAKAHWGYDAAWIERWRSDLRVTADQIAAGGVFVYVDDGEIVGVSQIIITDERAELEKLFVDPQAHGRGCGRCLFKHAIKVARDAGCTLLTVESDPNATAFYQHMGMTIVSQQESMIAGRFLPRLIYPLDA